MRRQCQNDAKAKIIEICLSCCAVSNNEVLFGQVERFYGAEERLFFGTPDTC